MSSSIEQNNYNFTKELNSFYTYLEAVCLSYDNVILYGAGTVSKIATSLFPKNIKFILDQDNSKKEINQITVLQPEEILKIEYDIILITVLGRELKITEYLFNQLKVPANKIATFNINITMNISDEERYLRAKLYQKKLNCNFNLIPYKINNKTKIMNLIFFMGIGDYLYVTPLLKKIKTIHPEIKLIAYASRNSDQLNNPLVYDILKHDENIDDVYYYDGSIGERLEEYNYSDAIRQISTGDNTIYPIVFSDTNVNSKHRVLELFKSFSLELDSDIIPQPLVYIKEENQQTIRELVIPINNQNKAVVFLHLESRSASYNYNESNKLIEALIANNFFVVLIAGKQETHIFDKNSFFHLNISKYKIYDSIAFMNDIKKTKYMIAVNSVMFPIASALNIPMLALFIFKDSTQTRQTYYPNMTVLTTDENCYKFLLDNQYKCEYIDSTLVTIDNGFCINYPTQLIMKYFLSDDILQQTIMNDL